MNKPTSPETKKLILMNLIDDMTAAAVDRTSQSHIQFIQIRTELINTIDAYVKEDRKRINAIKAAAAIFNEIRPGLITVNITE